ncbi:MAG: DUF3710 domain-containing protein [Corynebacterium sp.]|nr:DUF3710 domain-containing protein [Corynebacterium sp.]
MWFRKSNSEESAPETPVEEVLTGPFDETDVDLESYDFSDYGEGALDLGSLYIPMPFGSDLQVEVGPNGPSLIHIRTSFGRVTPVAFAAPTKAGQWRESLAGIREQLRGEGFAVTQVDGEFGPEVVGEMGPHTLRIIGVDGPRWMLRFTTLAATGSEEEMREAAYEMLRRTVVRRGDQPLAPGTGLPVSLPTALAEQVASQLNTPEPEVAPEPEVIPEPEPAPEPAPEPRNEQEARGPRAAVGNAQGHVPPVHRMDTE